MATAADSQDAPRSDSVRFAVGLIRKGGSRGGVGRMAQRNNWASHVIWGAIAVVAVLAATVTIALVVSSHRGIQIAMPGKRPAPAVATEVAQAPVPTPKAAPAPSSREHEIARLNDALRALAAERDQLAERLESVERTLGGITASVPRSSATRSALSVAEAEGSTAGDGETARVVGSPGPFQRIAAAPTQPVPPSDDRRTTPPGVVASIPGEIFQPYAAAGPAVVPPIPGQAPMQIHALPRSASSGPPLVQASAASRTEFAIDLGSEPTMAGLQARWANLRSMHGSVLANLRPLASIRDGNRPGTVELRLIAGPLPNAGDAARICAALQTKGVNCQATEFNGQRLALR
jgi:hypothetical protein